MFGAIRRCDVGGVFRVAGFGVVDVAVALSLLRDARETVIAFIDRRARRGPLG